MSENVVDFNSRKNELLLKRKEAKVDALRKAFRIARGESGPDKPTKPTKTGKNRSKTRPR